MAIFNTNTTGDTDPQNLLLGRGKLYLATLSSSLPDTNGWRDLGNVKEFSINITTETLEHVSSREGTRTVDKSVVTQIQAKIAFKLDEISKENMALWSSGESASHTNVAVAGFTEQLMISDAKLARHYDIVNAATPKERAYDIDASKLTVKSAGDGVTTVTASGGRTIAVAAAGKTFTASTGSFITDGFTVGRKILTTGFVASAGANNGTFTVAAVSALVLTVVEVVVDEAAVSAGQTIAGTKTTLVKDTDYTVDLKQGRIFLMPTTILLADGEGVYVTLTADSGAVAVVETRALTQTSQTVALKFIGENPADNDREVEVQFHQVILKPDGDFALIGDSWAEMGFSAVVERNAVADADAPYFRTRTHANA